MTATTPVATIDYIDDYIDDIRLQQRPRLQRQAGSQQRLHITTKNRHIAMANHIWH